MWTCCPISLVQFLMSEVGDGIVSIWPFWHPSDAWASMTFQNWVFWYPLMHTLSSVNCYYFHIILSTWVSHSKDKDLFCTLAHEFTQHRCTALWNSNICPAFAAAFFPRLIFSLFWGCEVPHICQALALSLTAPPLPSLNLPAPSTRCCEEHKVSILIELHSHFSSGVYTVSSWICVSASRSQMSFPSWASPGAIFPALLLRWVGDLFQARHWHHPLRYRLGPLLSGWTSSYANPDAEKPVLLKLPY